jgi:hypothetical protein
MAGGMDFWTGGKGLLFIKANSISGEIQTQV